MAIIGLSSPDLAPLSCISALLLETRNAAQDGHILALKEIARSDVIARGMLHGH